MIKLRHEEQRRIKYDILIKLGFSVPSARRYRDWNIKGKFWVKILTSKYGYRAVMEMI